MSGDMSDGDSDGELDMFTGHENVAYNAICTDNGEGMPLEGMVAENFDEQEEGSPRPKRHCRLPKRLQRSYFLK